MLTVHALPYEYAFDPKHTALIMIDMQRDFIEAGGFGAALGNNVSLLRAIIPTSKALLTLCRANGIKVIHTKEAHKPDLSDCPPSKLHRGGGSLKIGDSGPMGRILVDGEIGSDFIPELAPLAWETVIVKPGKGAFYATELQAILQMEKITHLIFAGVTTEVCVQTSMREANDRGYECLLIEDATESYFPQYKKSTLEMLRAQGGIVGWTAPLQLLAEAMQR
ncbi:MAG TPA: isochorismatase family cysteine hydrolase [Burkholderiaceae bacterium]|jgi:nicotinamidase-related amidase